MISIADLISMDILLSVAPNMREAAASLMQGDHKSKSGGDLTVIFW